MQEKGYPVTITPFPFYPASETKGFSSFPLTCRKTCCATLKHEFKEDSLGANSISHVMHRNPIEPEFLGRDVSP